MTIKPEDISDEVDEKIDDAAKKANEVAFDRKQTIAAILNAAIEAGVVSPPCCWVKTDDGKAMKTHENVPYLFPGKAWGPYEHWKGQTE